MDLDPNNSADLAVFFAKRFPHTEQRSSLATEAHIRFREPPTDEANVAWGGLLTRAREQAALKRLARCAARRIPEDENLQGVSAVLNGRAWPPLSAGRSAPPWLRQAAVMAALLLIGVGSAWLVGGQEPEPEVAAVEANEPVALVATQPTPSAEDAPRLTKSVLAPAPTDDATLEVAVADGSAEPPVEEAPVEEAAAMATETATSQLPGCRGRPGELVGYWYAGRVSPGKAGDRITVPQDLNVRADYPDRHNNFDARTSVRCTLAEGAPLVLSAAPIAVPGGAYWVPLHTPGPRS